MANTEERKQFKYMKFLRDSSSKKTMYYLATFTFLAALLLAVFAIRPTLLTISKINKEIKEKESINKALEDKINAMVQLDAQYAENKEELEALELIFPTSGNFSLFLSNIDAVIARNGFSLRAISFTDYNSESYDITASALTPWNVQLTVFGPLSNIDNLLEEFEDMPMYPVIERLSYNEEEEDGLKSFALSLRIYHIKNNKFYGEKNESD